MQPSPAKSCDPCVTASSSAPRYYTLQPPGHCRNSPLVPRTRTHPSPLSGYEYSTSISFFPLFIFITADALPEKSSPAASSTGCPLIFTTTLPRPSTDN